MEKKPYARIDYTNLYSIDYDYTIVTLSELADHSTDVFKQDVEDLDEPGYESWKASNNLPEIKITVVMMTDQEYEEWFAEHVEPTA